MPAVKWSCAMTERLDYTLVAGAGMKAFGGVHASIAQCGLPKIAGERHVAA
jgi:hypothetical protein